MSLAFRVCSTKAFVAFTPLSLQYIRFVHTLTTSMHSLRSYPYHFNAFVACMHLSLQCIRCVHALITSMHSLRSCPYHFNAFVACMAALTLITSIHLSRYVPALTLVRCLYSRSSTHTHSNHFSLFSFTRPWLYECTLRNHSLRMYAGTHHSKQFNAFVAFMPRAHSYHFTAFVALTCPHSL
jgi:hypothetical protein